MEKKTKTRHKESNAVKQLEIFANKSARTKNPTIAANRLANQKYSDKTVHDLTKCLIYFLRFSDCQAERISNTGWWLSSQETFTNVIGRKRTIGSSKLIPGIGTKGIVDISATIRGRSVKIEVKISRDRQSEAQKLYQLSVEGAGGIYIIATSFEQFYMWFNSNY